MKINIRDWKEFYIEDLFSIFENGKANQGMLEEGNECFYIGAKRDDNGVMIHCKKDLSLLQKGNCIIFICNGQGSVGYANYMDRDFIGTTDIVAGYNENLNKYNGVFLATVFCQERPKYSFGRKWKTHLKKTVVKLPVKHDKNNVPVIDKNHVYSKKGYIPDWQFMEDYIKSLRHKPLITANKSGKNTVLDTSDWKDFSLKDLFGNCIRGTRITIDDRIEGNIPFVTAGEFNEGVSAFIENPEAETFSNALTIDMFGNCFYHNYKFKCDDNILVVKNKHLNSFIGNFIATIISTDKYKNSYGRQYRQKDYAKHIIKLPADANGNPNWQFMENYIKALPYGDKLQ